MNQKSMVLMNCSVLEVDNVISFIKKNGSKDDISMKFFRSSLFYVAPYTFELLNLEIYQGVYPDKLKIVKVIHIHKKMRVTMLQVTGYFRAL